MENSGVHVAVIRGRLLPRLAHYVLQHVHLLSALCYIGGVLLVLLLPLLSKSTYISENALMPGSASAVFGHLDAVDANNLAKEIKSLVGKDREFHKWLVKQIVAVGADCYLQPFPAPQEGRLSRSAILPSLHPGWSSLDGSMSNNYEGPRNEALNVVGIIRAPQGEGNEAVVVVTPFLVGNTTVGNTLALGVGLALFRVLSRALWLARDVIWLVVDAQYGVNSGVTVWLKEYHEPSIAKLQNHDLVRNLLSQDTNFQQHHIDDLTLGDFKRAGTIAAGVVFEVHTPSTGPSDYITVSAEGPNGQMPNLDFLNIVNSIAVWRENLHIRLEVVPSLQNFVNSISVRKFIESVGSLAASFQLKGIAPQAAAYGEGLVTLVSSMIFQVFGLPTGAHGAFRHYQIDSLSLRMPISDDNSKIYFLAKYGRLLEGVLRSVNNLLEKFHQSFFLYFLSAPNKYISVGVYMIPFSLLMISLPLVATSLALHVKEEQSSSNSIANDCHLPIPTGHAPPALENVGEITKYSSASEIGNVGRWIAPLSQVTLIQLWALFVAMCTPAVSEMKVTEDSKVMIWLLLGCGGFLVSQLMVSVLSSSYYVTTGRSSGKETYDWVLMKALTLGVTTTCLAVMSAINYAVGLVGALLLVPMCLCVHPIKYMWKSAVNQSNSKPSFIQSVVGMVLTLLEFPPMSYLLVSLCMGHLWSVSSIWLWFGSLLYWESAMLWYILGIHLPCSVLCLQILFAR